MNIHEAARRMRKAGRWMILIPVGLALLLVGREVVYGFYHLGNGGLYPGIFGLVPLTVPGALLWLAGWIVEGFAEDTKNTE
jgi:hypothetical protein